jgi:hypothetical protein
MRLEHVARINISAQTRKELERLLRYYENLGNLSAAKRIMAILAVAAGNTYSKIVSIFKVSEESIRLWIKIFLLKGPEGLKSKKITGSPSKLTKSQKEKLEKFIIECPAAA